MLVVKIFRGGGVLYNFETVLNFFCIFKGYIGGTLATGSNEFGQCRIELVRPNFWLFGSFLLHFVRQILTSQVK